jgi:hypothetical protein
MHGKKKIKRYRLKTKRELNRGKSKDKKNVSKWTS